MKSENFLLRLIELMLIAIFVFSDLPVLAQESEDVKEL